MPKYKVKGARVPLGEKVRVVEADNFEIKEGGVIAFYRGRGRGLVDQLNVALKQWDEVERVED